MAASTINTECKRYGCMKNLLACFANCRYTMRCDELRNELADKASEAESDINRYLSERGRNPILVQILKRGVKFDDPAKPAPRQPSALASTTSIAARPRRKPLAKARPAATPRPSLAAAQLPRATPKRLLSKLCRAGMAAKSPPPLRKPHRRPATTWPRLPTMPRSA